MAIEKDSELIARFKVDKIMTETAFTNLIHSKARVYQSEAVSVVNEKLEPVPDKDKYVDLIDQAAIGSKIRIGLGTSTRTPNTFIRLMLITDGVNAVEFSPDFPALWRSGTIDDKSVNLYMIWLSYIREDIKFAQILKLPDIKDSAPSATFTPGQGEVMTDLSANISIDFDQAIRNIDLTEIDDSNVASLITFKLTDANGADVLFTATINSSKNQIVVNPDSNLTEDQQYYIAVDPVENYSGYEMTSASAITFTSTAGALTTPTNLTANTISTSQIDLSWDNVANEQGYELQASKDQTNWSVIATTATDVTSFSHTGLGPGETWYYRVKALGDGTTNTDSDWSTTAQATTDTEQLATPANFAATAEDDNKIRLTWDDVANEVEYEVERSGDGGATYNPLAIVSSNTTEYLDDSGLSPSTEYYYRIRAVGDGSVYTSSNWAEAFDTTLAEDTTNPTVTGVEIKNGSPDNMHVTYSEPVDATTAGYNVDTDSATALNITAIASGNGTSVVVFQLDRAVEDTETLNLDYDDITGDTTDDSSNSNPLASFTDQAVTNSVESFTPADVSAFWGAARLEGYANNDPVNSLTNQVGGGTNAVQADAGAQPTFITGEIATHPVIRAAGGGEELDFQDTYNTTVLQQVQSGFTFVTKQVNITDGDHPFMGAGQNTVTDWKLSADVAGDNYTFYYKAEDNNQYNNGAGTIDGNPHIVSFWFDWTGDQILIRVDGATVATLTHSAIAATDPAQFVLSETMKLFGFRNDPTAEMDIAELNFGGMALADVQSCEDYYNGIYSIY